MHTQTIAFVVIALTACGGRIASTSEGDKGRFTLPPPTDASKSDVSAPDAAMNGAVDSAFPNNGSWCDNFKNSTLCDDFDPSQMPRAEWSILGSPSVVSMPHQSAPHALRIQTTTSAYLTFTSKPAVAAKMSAELLVAADGESSNDDPTLFAISAEGGQGAALEIIPGTNLARWVVTGFSGGTSSKVVTLTRGAWHSIVLKISSDIIVSCVIDGAFESWSVQTSQPFGKMTHDLGVRGTTWKPIEAFYDNVVIDDAL